MSQQCTFLDSLRGGSRGGPRRPPAAGDANGGQAARAQAVANLETLMAAMHEYHDLHLRFPPAIILGKGGEGTVPHSWRVELLPYLGERALYDAYRFDQPWDSPHNRQLLTRMPAVFRSPLDAADSTHTSYFGIVLADDKPAAARPEEELEGGQIVNGVFVPPHSTVLSRPQGATMAEIADGTSNTVALVEAKRSTPWTRPDDIACVADRPIAPQLGGWFPEGWHAGYASGEVRFISHDNDEKTLRELFTIAGREDLRPKLVDAENENRPPVAP